MNPVISSFYLTLVLTERKTTIKHHLNGEFISTIEIVLNYEQKFDINTPYLKRFLTISAKLTSNGFIALDYEVLTYVGEGHLAKQFQGDC